MPTSKKPAAERMQTSAHHAAWVRRKEISNLYVQGKTQEEIAHKLNIAVGTVCTDLKEIREVWITQARDDFATRLAHELAKIDRLEEVSWEAWFRSCEDAQTVTKNREYGKKPAPPEHDPKNRPMGKRVVAEPIPEMVVTKKNVQVVTKGQAGDPRFLSQIQACIDMRLRVIGAYKQAETIGGKVNNVLAINWDALFQRSAITDPAAEAIAALPSPQEIKAGKPAKEKADG
jgi:DNA-binding CsgD family transcriptional regulator